MDWHGTEHANFDIKGARFPVSLRKEGNGNSTHCCSSSSYLNFTIRPNTHLEAGEGNV